ncbi:MAG TPA: ATP-binding protein [Terriglobia bacterium]|nr:ATP-binding protein [Terriglobia bacterium]
MPVNTRFGLQGKIIAITAVTVVLVVGISTLMAMWLTDQPVEEEIYRKVADQARLTAHQLADTGALANSDALLRALRQVEHDTPGVRQLDVYLHGANGAPDRLITTEPTGEHLELDRIRNIENYNEFFRPAADQMSIETPKGDYWIIATTIRDHGVPVGCLNLKASKSRLNAITGDLVLRNLLVLIAGLGIIIFVIHVFFLRSVRSPVKEMIRVMVAAEGGALETRAGIESGDEIGQLAGHLNAMLARLENFNSELGRKVSEATSELARRNEDLTCINEELFETQKTLARSERLAVAGQLAASLAHEIGTPLNSISGHVQLLARRKTGDKASDRRLQIIENQIENIVRTVKQLLSWTRKFDLRLDRIDLHRVLEDTVLLSSAALEVRRIHVRTVFPLRVPPIYGDAGYLQQVFLNLINNSMDAMPRGGQLDIRLTAADGAAGAQAVRVEVEDTGEGILPEMLAHIFDPMFTTKRIGTGAGLGLAICKQIIQQHGGTIEVKSRPQQGACFTVGLPVDCRMRGEATVPGALVASG